ncbi:MAG TPA: Holliday junction resolvase RuvX [Kiritimatiellia bacterium]|nr:Holliday junction resolvase RuvX [Kiritimatiellia bacterium]
MSKVLGVDYGERRTGIAISDEARVIAFPRETLECSRVEQAAAAVARIAAAEKVAEIVVGQPVNMNGSHGPRAARTDEFLAELAKRTDLPLKKWDERLSTKIAEAVLLEAGASRRRRKGVVDKLAAQVILQGYLDAADGPVPDGEDAP